MVTRESELAVRFGVHRRDMRAALDSAVPAPRKTPERPAPKMDEFKAVIDDWLKVDQSLPRKPRHTARRVWQRWRTADSCCWKNISWSPENTDHPSV